MKKIRYGFSVLRYVHDPVTQEFLNIGVVVYAREVRFLQAKCTTHYRRVTRTFVKIEGNRFRELTRYIEEKLNSMGASLPSELPFEPGPAIELLLSRVLPVDDSSFQFSPAGAGVTSDLATVLTDLFNLYVDRYTSAGDSPRREDEDVWRVFRRPLDDWQVSALLTPKKIVAPNYEYEFQHSWQNQVWHVYEPISFDLTEGALIVDKANRWLGRASTLQDSREKFKMHLLLGTPQEPRLKANFKKAQNILNKIPVNKELVLESEAEAFAKDLAQELRLHFKDEAL